MPDIDRRVLRVRERHGEAGAALAAVLVVIALLLPLGALAVLQARIGFLTQQSLRGDTEALHDAEGGLACALARLDPKADPAQLARGADGIGGTMDDGVPPFALDCGGGTTDVHFEAAGSEAIAVVATGHGMRRASRSIERDLERGPSGELEPRGWRER